MKRLHVDNIKLGKIYYKVCVGQISRIKFIKINLPKAKYKVLDHDFIIESFLSDIGIDYDDGGSEDIMTKHYINSTNQVFKYEYQAIVYISDSAYQQRLKRHFNDINTFIDYIFPE